jgi:hypothetical protein
MMQGLRSVSLQEETEERKERRACGNKVEVKNDSNDEERKQRFFKKSHGGLLSREAGCRFDFRSSARQNRRSKMEVDSFRSSRSQTYFAALAQRQLQHVHDAAELPLSSAPMHSLVYRTLVRYVDAATKRQNHLW